MYILRSVVVANWEATQCVYSRYTIYVWYIRCAIVMCIHRENIHNISYSCENTLHGRIPVGFGLRLGVGLRLSLGLVLEESGNRMGKPTTYSTVSI